QRLANPYVAAERGFVDEVVEPSQTRRKIAAGLRMLESKREELPERKHGNVPL
ncbi:MAG: methylmalonyl-CoA carboxyltransferase, partial [bacterium]|nr:methylmalonyl-CoA carboxyltransferase [bacterium]